MKDYEKNEAAIKLMAELEKGRISGEKEGWHSLDDVRKYLSIEEFKQNMMEAIAKGAKHSK